MLKRIVSVSILFCGIFALWIMPVAAQTEENGGGANPQRLQQTVTNGITQNQQAQGEIDRALERGLSAMEELRVKKDDLRWTEYQITKYKQYIEAQKERIAELERQKVAMHEIQRALEPYLDQAYLQLAELVAADLPFMQGERQARLANLQADLNDHRLSIAEKTSRLLDVLRVESSYAMALNTENVVLELPNGPVNVRLFNVGRLALYYQTEDGSQSGWYDKATGKWRLMTAKEGKELTQALNIVDKRSVPALVNLPVGRP